MKIKNKLLVSIFAISFFAMSFNMENNKALATSINENVNTPENQQEQLQKAVDDTIKVVNSEVYYTYTSQELKSEYEKAIANAKLVLAKKDASYDELRDATAMVNKAKKDIKDAMIKIAEKINTKNQLEKALNDNKIKANMARDLLTNYPKTVAKVKGKLQNILKSSETLVKEAESLLKQLNI